MTSTETLKGFSFDFYPSRDDYLIAYGVLTFLRNEYVGKDFSNIDCCFSTILHVIEKRYSKVTI